MLTATMPRVMPGSPPPPPVGASAASIGREASAPYPLYAGVRAEDFTALAGNAILGHLAPQQLGSLIERMDQVTFPAGSVVLHPGAPHDHAYFVLEGTARLHRGNVALRAVGSGDHFGELAIAGIADDALTVEAQTTLRLARLSAATLSHMSTSRPLAVVHLLQALIAALAEDRSAMVESVGTLLRLRSLARRTEVEVASPEGRRAVKMGTALGEVLPETLNGDPVIAGLVDRRPMSLDAPIVSDATVSPLTRSSPEGEAIARRSAGLLLLEAASRVAPARIVRLGPSLEWGQIIHVDADAAARDALARDLARTMSALVADDVPFREELWTIEEASSHFSEHAWKDAALLLQTRREATVMLASCGGLYAIAPGPMLRSAGEIGSFGVAPHPQGLLLHLAPEKLPEGALAREQAHPHFGGPMALEHRAWLDALGVTSVGAFNARVVSGRAADLIRSSEGFHEKHIGRIADAISAARERVRVIAIAGPSSSGKTTFIKRLSVQLTVNGVHPVNVSLDDYFLDRDKTPLGENGEPDFERLDALDLERLRVDVAALLRGERVRTSRYDFIDGKSRPGRGPELEVGGGSVLVLEGIHALSPALLGDAVPREAIFGVFVHPATYLPYDRLTALSPRDVRLMRRIVRDRHGRGIPARENIRRWPDVCAGETRHILPTQPNADAEFDTSLAYEPSVLKVFAERYLLEVPADDPGFSTAYRLRQLLEGFVAIDPGQVPPTSILREFVGGSGFEY